MSECTGCCDEVRAWKRERDELREALREARKWLNPVPTFEAEERVREMIDRLLSRPEATQPATGAQSQTDQSCLSDDAQPAPVRDGAAQSVERILNRGRGSNATGGTEVPSGDGASPPASALPGAVADAGPEGDGSPLPAMVPCPLCVERGWPPTCPETGDDCEECFGTGQVVEAAPVRDAGVKEEP